MRFEKKSDENKIEYLMRLVGYKLDEKPDDLEWLDIIKYCDIRKNNGEYIHYDTLRKAMQPEDIGAYAIYEYMLENSITESEYFDKLEEKHFEIKKEIAKLTSLRNVQNEHARNQGRKDFILKEIEDHVKNAEPLVAPKYIPRSNDNDNPFICCIADAHFGKDIVIEGLNGENLNVYNPDIFKERMWKLRDEYIDLFKEHNVSRITLLELSDSIEGILRTTGLMAIKYGIVESAIKYGHFMAKWINELSKYVDIDYYSCLGNHCEARILDGKSGDFWKESMQYVIDDIIRTELRDNNKVVINEVKPLQYFEVGGIKILATHGQNEKNLVDSVFKYKEIYDIKFDYLITGHLHSSKQETASLRTKAIQCPSIIGIDSFSMKLKKTAKGEAKAILCKGNKLYNIDIEL